MEILNQSAPSVLKYKQNWFF